MPERPPITSPPPMFTTNPSIVYGSVERNVCDSPVVDSHATLMATVPPAPDAHVPGGVNTNVPAN